MSMDPRQKLAEILREKGNGNLLRGWRRELDHDSSMHCGYMEFCQKAERLGYHEDVATLFAMDGDMSSLRFSTIGPDESRVLLAFKEWIKAKYGGPTEWLESFDPSGDGLSPDEFVRQCRSKGFTTSTEESISEELLQDLHAGIDLNICGLIHHDEIPFLELDPLVREQELFQLKQLKVEEERRRLTKSLEEGRAIAKKLSPAHRLAQRGWHERHYEHLPSVVMQKKSRG